MYRTGWFSTGRDRAVRDRFEVVLASTERMTSPAMSTFRGLDSILRCTFIRDVIASPDGLEHHPLFRIAPDVFLDNGDKFLQAWPYGLVTVPCIQYQWRLAVQLKSAPGSANTEGGKDSCPCAERQGYGTDRKCGFLIEKPHSHASPLDIALADHSYHLAAFKSP